MKYVFNNYANNTNTYVVCVIRYNDGHYFNYIFMKQASGDVYAILEYTYHHYPISIYYYSTDTGNIMTSASFSNDATLLGQITNLKYKDINYGNVTIPSNGYIRWSDTVTGSPNDQIDGTILFATIGSWGSNGGHCFNVNQTYCIGEANMTITNLNVRFWYIE